MSLSKIFVNNTQIVGVDDEPTAVSENLVKSGGVSNKLSELKSKLDGKFYGYYTTSDTLPTITQNGYAYVGVKAPFEIWNALQGKWEYSEVKAGGSQSEYIATPQMFGAVADGVTDDSNAFQLCADYSSINQVEMYIPAGVYRIEHTIFLSRPQGKDYTKPIRISGSKMGSALRKTGSCILCATDNPIFCIGIDLDNRFLVQNGTGNVDIGNLAFHGVDGFTSTAIRIGSFTRPTIHDLNCYQMTCIIDEPETVFDTDGVEIVNYPDVIKISRIFMSQQRGLGSTGAALIIRHADCAVIEQVVSEQPVDGEFYRGIYFNSCSAITIKDVMFSMNSGVSKVLGSCFLYFVSSTGVVENFRVEHSCCVLFDCMIYSSQLMFNGEKIWYTDKSNVDAIYDIYNSIVNFNSCWHACNLNDFNIQGEQVHPIKLTLKNCRFTGGVDGVDSYTTERDYRFTGVRWLILSDDYVMAIYKKNGSEITPFTSMGKPHIYASNFIIDNDKLSQKSQMTLTSYKQWKAEASNGEYRAIIKKDNFTYSDNWYIELYHNGQKLTGEDLNNALDKTDIYLYPI